MRPTCGGEGEIDLLFKQLHIFKLVKPKNYENHLFVFLSLIFALGSVAAQNTVTLKTGENLNTKAAELTAIFQKIMILEGVSQMKNFELTKDENSEIQYVAGEGLSKEGNNIVFRVQATVTVKNKETRIKLTNKGGKILAESCTSATCSTCRFAKTGGCECDANTDCNHNISK